MIPWNRVEFDHEYYIVELNNVRLPNEVREWLRDNFGEPEEGRWFLKHPNLYFRNSTDHLMFTIRWS